MSAVYYKEDYPLGEWVIYRTEEGRAPEIYHRQNGWAPYGELRIQLMQGEIDEDNIISEEVALALIRTLPAPPAAQLAICPSCRLPVSPTAKFCEACGTRVAPELSSEPPAPPPPVSRGAVLPWLRAASPRGSGIASEAPGHVVALAVALRRARDEHRFSDEAFRALHGALRVQGPGGVQWTVGLASMQWSCLTDGQWRQADAPASVYLDQALIQKVAGLTPRPGVR